MTRLRMINLTMAGFLVVTWVPVLFALAALPWAALVPGWVLPVTLGIGAVGGVLLVQVPRRWWLFPPALVAILAGCLGVTFLLFGHVTALVVVNRFTSVENLAGAAALVAFIMVLPVLTMGLVFQARAPFFALVLLWLAIMGAAPFWFAHAIIPPPAWWVGVLVLSSVALLGLHALWGREQRRILLHLTEVRAGTAPEGVVFWIAFRQVMLCVVILSLIGLAPLSGQAAWLHASWNAVVVHLPGNLVQYGNQGTPVAQVGLPLSLQAPMPDANTIVARYTLLGGALPSPLLATLFDTFDGMTWRQSATHPVMDPSLSVSPGTSSLTVRITLEQPPLDGDHHWVIGMDQPVQFRGAIVPEAQVTTDGVIAGWSVASPPTTGNVYRIGDPGAASAGHDPSSGWAWRTDHATSA